MLKTDFRKNLQKIIRERNKIPEDFWRKAENGEFVLWFLSREDGTAGSYETSQERFGITKNGKIIYGFTSGCSCWDGWSKDEFTTKTYKEFEVLNITTFPQKEYADRVKDCDISFSEGWEDESNGDIKDYLLLLKDKVSPKEALSAKNAEVRRYLIKKVGYNALKKKLNATVIHTDGANELIDVKIGEETERYVKVKDNSTSREYLLYVGQWNKTCKQAIAWTFNLSESTYKPVLET